MSNLLFAMIVNHLWQSTLVGVVLGGLALLLRRNSARVRYALWFAASLKFLVPFAVLAAFSTLIPWHPEVSDSGTAPLVMNAVSDVAAPWTGEAPFPKFSASGESTTPESRSLLSRDELITIAAFIVWLIGFVAVAVRWLVRWLEIRRALRRSVRMEGIDFPAPVYATDQQFEPGVVGVIRPRLLLPAGIEERLTPEQMRAVLAHESCHLRRRDNLTASLHMLTEAIFWYFPPVWWIGVRLIDERERACDEQVVRDGHKPESYAEGILNVCEHYIASRLPCVSGVSGADLRKRVESIVKRVTGVKLTRSRKIALSAVACCIAAAPIAAGIVSGNAWQVGISSYMAGLQGYTRVGTAGAEDLAVATRKISSGRASSCQGPSAKYIKEQKRLAAIVARLSANDGELVLRYAIAANSKADVKRLLASGASRASNNFPGIGSPMHEAAQFGDVAILETLAAAGIPIDEWQGTLGEGGTGVTARTPLMIAVSAGNRAKVEWFIQHGADASATNERSGQSPLVVAMAMCRDKELVGMLLKAGAKPSFKALRIADNLGFDLRTDPSMPGPPVQSWVQDPNTEKGLAEYNVDYDGDDKPDRFSMFFSPNEKQRGAAGFVKLSSRNPDQWIKVFATPPETRGFTLGFVKSGTQLTACGSKKPCKSGEAAELVLKNPGISLSTAEGGTRTFYLAEAGGRFLSVEDGPAFEHPFHLRNPWN